MLSRRPGSLSRKPRIGSCQRHVQRDGHCDGHKGSATRIVFSLLKRAVLPAFVRELGAMTPDNLFTSTNFPRSSRHHPEWILASVSGAANSLWLTEWLASAMDLKPGMRLLDLGCGRAASSIFLRREFGVQVWGNGPMVRCLGEDPTN